MPILRKRGRDNQTQIWQNPQLPDVEFFSAHYTDFAYAPHFHEDYALGVMEHGVHSLLIAPS